MQIIFHSNDIKPSAIDKTINNIKLSDIKNGKTAYEQFPDAGIVLSTKRGSNVYRECK